MRMWGRRQVAAPRTHAPARTHWGVERGTAKVCHVETKLTAPPPSPATHTPASRIRQLSMKVEGGGTLAGKGIKAVMARRTPPPLHLLPLLTP